MTTTTTSVAARPTVRPMRPAPDATRLLRHTLAGHALLETQAQRTGRKRTKALRPHVTGPSGRCSGCGRRIGAPPYAVPAAAPVGAAGLVMSGHTGRLVGRLHGVNHGAIVLAIVNRAVIGRRRAPPPPVLVLLVAAANAATFGRAVTDEPVAATFLAVLAVAPRGLHGLGEASLAVPVTAALGWLRCTAVSTGIPLGRWTAAHRDHRDHASSA